MELVPNSGLSKRIIVTGASSGIGLATAQLFLTNNHRVVLVGRNKEKLQKIHDKFPHSSITIIADVSIVEDCQRIIDLSVSKWQGIDILINNAGILGNIGNSIETTSLQQWNLVMETNLKSVFILTQLVLPHLEKSKGNIVNISSIASSRTFPN